MPISCHFRDCKALLFESTRVSSANALYPNLYLFTEFDHVALSFEFEDGAACRQNDLSPFVTPIVPPAVGLGCVPWSARRACVRF